MMRACLLILAGIVAGAGCATSPQANPQTPVTTPGDVNTPGDTVFDELEEEFARKEVTIPDPLEPVNRVMYGVNDVLYFWIVKPISQAYATVVAKPVRIGIGNFFHNVATPSRLVNCLLQGKGPAAGTEVQRFAINTTAGVLGFGDPARDRWGLKPAEEDLGQTLGVYGMGEGFYMVWPFFGPTTVRDSLGMFGNQFLNPVRYVEPTEVSLGLSAVSGVNQASLHIGEYEAIKSAAVDPYVAMRAAYVQYRRMQIQDQTLPDQDSAKPQVSP
ncbi:MAG: VacJ family lipoprotein [Sedimentisphaerales bacterium]|nr:VacJ family lipoprotein [Sedimentisphaerales bacterium]